MTFKVAFTASAKADLFAIYDYIADRGGEQTARRFVESIETYCLGYASFPERGLKRDDLRPGLRTVGFKRPATVLFEVKGSERQVVIHGIYYAGRSFEEIDEDA
jgi:toxin ParE1/3/4